MTGASHSSLVFRRFLIQPCGLAASTSEVPAICTCLIWLGLVLALELLTPRDVVMALAAFPVAVATWALSGRPAAVIVGLVAASFAVAISLESTGRVTLSVVALTTIVLGILIRLYAVSLAQLAGQPRFRNPALAPSRKTPIWGHLAGTGHGVGALSRRELEVARLAATGYTAPEIGRTLHISTRTVESHLASTYAKLGVRSKRALIRLGSILWPDAQLVTGPTELTVQPMAAEPAPCRQ